MRKLVLLSECQPFSLRVPKKILHYQSQESFRQMEIHLMYIVIHTLHPIIVKPVFWEVDKDMHADSASFQGTKKYIV